MAIFDGSLTCERCKVGVPVKVCLYEGRYWVGQWCDTCGPISRISAEDWASFGEAEKALAKGEYALRYPKFS